MNTLYYGDNFKILQEYILDNSIDLIYLDPPFNSNRNYNVLFKDESGKESDAQITAFVDTWHWTEETERLYLNIVTGAASNVSAIIDAFRKAIGTNQMMAYLVMMTARLIHLHRVLKPTGSLYLHCDPTASHYLKIVLDAVFGRENFRNEIVWCYKRYTAIANRFQKLHDIIFFYSKEKNVSRFNQILISYGDKSGVLDSHYKQDKEGKWYRLQKRMGKEPYKIYLQEGVRLGDWWDIPIINASASERLGYPTQKPLSLLERIIEASSNEGDIVLDPFCGCGTTITAAHKLNRKWIGIDITHLSIALMKYRLKDAFDLDPVKDYQVIGEPADAQSARQLATEDRYQFQWWALSLVQARPIGGDDKKGKKGADKGIDGVINFIDDATQRAKRVIIQVKSGKIKSGDIRDLRGVLEREKAEIGIFITLEPPTRDMLTEANSSGFYHSEGWNRDYSRLQILTIEDLLNGKKIQMPPVTQTFKQAERLFVDRKKQGEMF
jgi:site-specific DNA-methyltransferase (adenine-specific)